MMQSRTAIKSVFILGFSLMTVFITAMDNSIENNQGTVAKRYEQGRKRYCSNKKQQNTLSASEARNAAIYRKTVRHARVELEQEHMQDKQYKRNKAIWKAKDRGALNKDEAKLRLKKNSK